MGATEPWLDDPLLYLIAPTAPADFIARVYEREPLIALHGEPKRFDGLLSIDAVDRIVTNTDLREGQLDLADASRQMTRAEFVDSAGYVNRGAVAELHRAGATIILQQAHQMEPALARFCRGLEHVFSAHVQTNLYLTPPNAQGFRTHYDNHDVFVVQVEGEKAWRLYDKPVDIPYRGERFQSAKHKPGPLREEFVLKAGDCAYVPRGLMHDAIASGGAASLHITIGLITRTWADLMLEAVSEVALRTPEFRRSLPPGYAQPGFDRTEARAYLRRIAARAAEEVTLDPALDLMIDSFIRSRAADNRFAVRDATAPVVEAASFKASAHAPYRIAEDGARIVVIAPGGELNFAADDRVAIERALSGATFRPANLGARGVSIATRLLAYGLIVGGA